MDNLVLFLWETGKVFMAVLLLGSVCSVVMNAITISKLEERMDEQDRRISRLSFLKPRRKYQRRTPAKANTPLEVTPSSK